MVVVVVVIVTMMIVTVARLIVGAMLRIERRFERREPCAEPAQHILDHMITTDAQPIPDDLYVDVTIADMPGEPRQLMHIRRRNLDQPLGTANNPHDSAIVEHKAIAIVQSSGLRQIEEKPRAAFAAHDDAAAVALMSVKRHGIDSARGVPMAGGFDFLRTLHA